MGDIAVRGNATKKTLSRHTVAYSFTVACSEIPRVFGRQSAILSLLYLLLSFDCFLIPLVNKRFRKF